MKRSLVILFCLSLMTTAISREKTDANIVGHVLSQGKHVSFVNVSVKATTIGTTTDETGHYQLIHLPVGLLTVRAQALGFKPEEITVVTEAGKTIELNFNLEEDFLELEGVVVTGNRNQTNRQGSSTIVNTITSKMFASSQSVTLSEGLEFCPGLRMENNCQNCGFTQLRMNGMEGPYSQILINSRPIFSGLAGVYGLELIPANMIERVEVIRGGGSALYGSNAIAGTINLILKDPINNAYEVGLSSGITGVDGSRFVNASPDHTIHFNTSLVSGDNKTGMALYGFYRDREPFDANNDGFSEIAALKNTTVGTRLFHRFGTKSKLSADFFNIKEDRRGGDRFEFPLHEANIAEAVSHNLTMGALTYEQFFRATDLFSVYASGQRLNRDSYYGAEQSLSDYGLTADFTYAVGSQYNMNLGKSSLTAGIENSGSRLKDKKLGYPDLEQAVIVDGEIVEIPHTENVIIADQMINTTGIFAQYEYRLDKLAVSAGLRYDYYRVEDREDPDFEKTGNVVSPRLTFRYDMYSFLKARLSYAQGYRAPQIFDEDLHIETSGSRKVIHENSLDLIQETSYSYMASLDFNRRIGKVQLGMLVEGFYTRLKNPFANEYSDPDENGVVVYTRVNAEEGAKIQGVNFELNVAPSAKFAIRSGFTVQSSKYEEEQEFDEQRFFRTPYDYGYFSLEWQAHPKLGISATGIYSGKMLIPYFGPEIPDQEEGVLRESPRFFDAGLKFKYDIKLNGATLQLYTGVRNIFNSYQHDFDTGIDRDAGYIYGPMRPRTIYFGVRVGNFLR
jgi:outer membrane receptor for ferrienterochelin and colicins